MQETQVQSLGREDPLEKGMANHSSILAWRVPWTEGPGRLHTVHGISHIVKGFGIVNKAEIDVFLQLSFFFDDPVDVGNLISGSSSFSKTSLNIWKFTVHVLLKPGLENCKHYFASV